MKEKVELQRAKGSVFVTVSPPKPVQIPSATHIGERFKSWVNIATEIAETEPEPEAQPTPAVQTPEPESKKVSDAPLGDPDEVRVSYIEKHTLKKVSIYRGDPFPNLDERCQTYADNNGVIVHCHTAREFSIFKPQPKKPDLQALLATVNAIMGVSS